MIVSFIFKTMLFYVIYKVIKGALSLFMGYQLVKKQMADIQMGKKQGPQGSQDPSKKASSEGDVFEAEYKVKDD